MYVSYNGGRVTRGLFQILSCSFLLLRSVCPEKLSKQLSAWKGEQPKLKRGEKCQERMREEREQRENRGAGGEETERERERETMPGEFRAARQPTSQAKPIL